jgi:phosphonate transport system permease protein
VTSIDAPAGAAKRGRVALLVAALVAVHVWAAVGTEFSPHKFRDIGNTWEFLKEGWPPRWSILPDTARASVTTLQIAIMGTTLPLLVALPLSFLAARTTSPSPLLYNVLRGWLSFLRSMPEFVFALLLIPAIGLGPFPGVIALALHNLGVLGKMISELIESAPTGPQEAVAATGARRVLIMCFGILPQIVPDVISQAFYRLEVNVRASVLLGFIGAGGIGQDLFVAFRVFQYREVVIHVAAILVLVILVDHASALVRKRVI